MRIHFGLALALVFVTTFIHAGCTAIVLSWMNSPVGHRWTRRGVVRRITVLGVLVFAMTVVALLQSMVWAGLYLWVGALPHLHEAVYFSLVTFTTLGYGDITLPEEWRLLAGFQAANGIIMFGVTTAIIVAVVHRLFTHPTTTADPG